MQRLVLVSSFIFFLSACKAQTSQRLTYGQQEVQQQQARSRLQCYDCNSEFDPRCADPFDPYTIGIINCTDRKTPNHLLDPLHLELEVPPVLCRKIIQKVEGKVRVIRGCGYIRDPHDDKLCYKRTGTANVEVRHCSCTKSLCNLAYSIHCPFRVITLVLIVLAITNTLNRLLR